MEFCQVVAPRSPRSRLGSVKDVGNRLRRTRGGFHRCIHIAKVLCALLLWTMICQRFRSRALWGAPSTGACGLGATRPYPYPGESPRADLRRRVISAPVVERAWNERSKSEYDAYVYEVTMNPQKRAVKSKVWLASGCNTLASSSRLAVFWPPAAEHMLF